MNDERFLSLKFLVFFHCLCKTPSSDCTQAGWYFQTHPLWEIWFYWASCAGKEGKSKVCFLGGFFFTAHLRGDKDKPEQHLQKEGKALLDTLLPKAQKQKLFKTKDGGKNTEVWWGSQRKRENRLFYLFKKHLVLITFVIPSLSLFSHPLLCLCPISQAPVAKVTDINSYDHRFSAPLITIYLCKSLCACVSKAGRDCSVCVCF